ncbi:hypothetical protein [Halobacillus salinus]|uniref:hypothetical protein n=1 Tax=Halobacillus salinus TaxID=192814 RepID=UPI0009A71203|nr:hypothetical protein [Halobacillus salinus]
MEEVNRTVFYWLHKHLRTESDIPAVQKVMPVIYERYCKVMNPAYLDQEAPEGYRFWSDHSVEDDPSFVLGEELTFQEIAKRYDIPYTNEISTAAIARYLGGIPRELVTPEEGNIDEKVLPKVVELVRSFTNGPLFFHYDLLSLKGDFMKDYGRYFKGELDDVYKFTEDDRVLGSPTYWWPEDRSWCIYTDEDLCYTIIGGSNSLVDSLLASDLEVIEVNPQTSL